MQSPSSAAASSSSGLTRGSVPSADDCAVSDPRVKPEDDDGGLEDDVGGLAEEDGGLEDDVGGLEEEDGGLEEHDGGLEEDGEGVTEEPVKATNVSYPISMFGSLIRCRNAMVSSRAVASISRPPVDHLDETFEQIMTVGRARACLGVVLDAERRAVGARQPLIGAIEQ